MRWYQIGVCTGCERDIIRVKEFKDGVLRDLSLICSCEPRLEVMFLMIPDGEVLVIWDEQVGAR